MKVTTYGQIAYEAYRAASEGKSLVSGESLPTWDEQDERIRVTWNVAGAAVSDAITGDGSELYALRRQVDDLATERRELRIRLQSIAKAASA